MTLIYLEVSPYMDHLLDHHRSKCKVSEVAVYQALNHGMDIFFMIIASLFLLASAAPVPELSWK